MRMLMILPYKSHYVHQRLYFERRLYTFEDSFTKNLGYGQNRTLTQG